MKVFVNVPTGLSRAMDRVVKALKLYAPPKYTFVDKEVDADLVILHVIGYPETDAKVGELLAKGKNYGIIQYCLRTTQKPNCASWSYLWENAEIVWSYYDLEKLARADGIDPIYFNFYRSALGVDSSVFHSTPSAAHGLYKVLTTGYVAVSESVGEVAQATKTLGVRHFHLGPQLHLGSHITYGLGMNDKMLSHIYTECEYVTGLRRTEGFELPAAEGLLCGARPILYDAPHYRDWFGEHAEYIKEDQPWLVTQAVLEILGKPARPVTAAERSEAAFKFDWKRIVSGFWKQLEV